METAAVSCTEANNRTQMIAGLKSWEVCCETIFAKSVSGRTAYCLNSPAPKASARLPADLLRKNAPRLPECSELEVVRHFTQLSAAQLQGRQYFLPLGSCTMKYNPKFMEHGRAMGFTRLHPMMAQLEGVQTAPRAHCTIFDFLNSASKSTLFQSYFEAIS